MDSESAPEKSGKDGSKAAGERRRGAGGKEGGGKTMERASSDPSNSSSKQEQKPKTDSDKPRNGSSNPKRGNERPKLEGSLQAARSSPTVVIAKVSEVKAEPAERSRSDGTGSKQPAKNLKQRSNEKNSEKKTEPSTSKVEEKEKSPNDTEATTNRTRQRSPRQGSANNAKAGAAATATTTVTSSPSDSVEFGVIVSLKDAFGFLQPYLKDEQVFFPNKELFSRVVVGDEISYKEKMGPKGLNAEGVQAVEKVKIIDAGTVTGVISKEPEVQRDRTIPGTIQLSSKLIADLCSKNPAWAGFPDKAGFMEDSYVKGATKRCIWGDEAEFQLRLIPGTHYCSAVGIKLARTKKERGLADQIDRMLAAGLSREQGVVDTIRGEYGFIKPVDRPDQIYFRSDDVVGGENPLKEGTEVSFFVVAEMIKGKVSDRAMHVEVLPAGSVEFETTVAESVNATVVTEPIMFPEEEPGKVKLHQAVSTASLPGGSVLAAGVAQGDLTEVELWSRCLSDSLSFMQFRVGDEVALDVQHYRPEKLFFARSVSVRALRKIGRELGVVCAVREQGFGFISSFTRDVDLYFRTAEIIDLSGLAVPESEITTGTIVSFDVTAEESFRGGGGGGGGGGSSSKLRAVRVRREKKAPAGSKGGRKRSTSSSSLSNAATLEAIEASAAEDPASDESASAIEATETETYVVIRTEVRGWVHRDAKRDAPGVIRLKPEFADLGREPFFPPEVVAACEEFRDCADLQEVVIEHLPNIQRKVYHELLDLKFPNIAHESRATDPSDPSKPKALRIWKLAPEEFAKWSAERQVQKKLDDSKKKCPRGQSELQQGQVVILSNDGPAGGGGAAGSGEVATILFARNDVNEVFGPLAKDLEVIFTLCLDRKTNKRVAKTVVLTDEPPTGEGETQMQFGVIDVVTSGSKTKFGFIRRIPFDEKIFWSIADVKAGTDSGSLQEGREVSFSLRLRGGLRCAVGVAVLPSGALSGEEDLDGTCYALVVADGRQAVLVDCSMCPLLKDKFWESSNLRETLAVSERGDKETKDKTSKSGSKLEQLWNKRAAGDSSEEAEAVAGSGTAAAGGAASADAVSATSTSSAPTGSPEAQEAAIQQVDALIDAATALSLEQTASPAAAEAVSAAAVAASSEEETVGVASALAGSSEPQEPQEAASSRQPSPGTPRYFPALPRLLLPILPDGATSKAAGDSVLAPAGEQGPALFAPGDWIECRAVANWSSQRQPLGVFGAKKVVGVPPLIKLRGAITRLKVRHKGGGGGEGSVNELCELKLYSSPSADGTASMVSPAAAAAVGAPSIVGAGTYYCDVRELQLPGELSRESVQLGDPVEFFGIEAASFAGAGSAVAGIAHAAGLAVGISFSRGLGGAGGVDGINFRKAGTIVRKDPKDLKKGGLNTILMAKGPDDSGGGIGFKAAWREQPLVASLPWAHLLPHL